MRLLLLRHPSFYRVATPSSHRPTTLASLSQASHHRAFGSSSSGGSGEYRTSGHHPTTTRNIHYPRSASSLLVVAAAHGVDLVPVSSKCLRYYSTSHPALQSSASTLLAELLTRERAEEIENDTLAVPPELADLKTKLEQEQWKVVDVGGTTRLTKALSNHPRGKVVVHFHCQDIVEELDAEEVYDEEEATEATTAEEAADEEEVAGAVRFTVGVSIPSQKTLVFQCVSEYGHVQIRSVTTTSTAVDELFQQGGTGGPDLASGGAAALGNPKDYQGPVFDELAHDLQQAFHQYLVQELGVNEDVAAFVSMHADYREQVNYVQFLDECHGAVSA